MSLRRPSHLAILVLLLALLAIPATAEAQRLEPAQLSQPPSTVLPMTRGELPPWQRALYKTITFQAVANATDLLLFESLIGGHPLLLGGFVVSNAATAAGLYFGFEYLWQQNGPPLEQTTETTIAKKSILFQAVNSGRIFLLGYTLGATAPAAGMLAGSVFLTDTVVYYANEYVWDILRPIASEPQTGVLTPSSIPVSYN